jgi:hypothetical protein
MKQGIEDIVLNCAFLSRDLQKRERDVKFGEFAGCINQGGAG